MFNGSTFNELYGSLPPGYQENIETDSVRYYSPRKNHFSLFLVGGVIIGVIGVAGGFFLVLASHQILPSGINSISNLGVGGYILGYSPIAVSGGVLALFIAMIVKFLRSHKKGSEDRKLNDLNQNAIRERKVKEFIKNHLAQDEMIVAIKADGKQMTIFYYTNKFRYQEGLAIHNNNSRATYNLWINTNSKITSSLHLIDLDTLKQREITA